MKSAPSKELLERLSPDPEAVFNRLRPQLDDRLLAVIAGADYGNEAEKHLKELKPIRDRGIVPAPMRWHPKEVLDLIRWTTPENEHPRWKTGLSLKENHLIRAFSCAVLLRAAAEPENDGFFDGENETLAPLIQSAFFLGEAAAKDALSLLAWLLARDRELYEDAPFFGLGAVLLAARSGAAPGAVGELAAWVLAEEARLRSMKGGSKFGPWLLGLTFHTIKNQLWRELLEPLPGDAGLPPEVQAILADLRKRVDSPWEDHFLPGDMLARAPRLGNVCLWTLPEALEVARRLGETVFDLKALVFYLPAGDTWREAARETIKRDFPRDVVTGAGIRAFNREQAGRLCSLLKQRMAPEAAMRATFELY